MASHHLLPRLTLLFLAALLSITFASKVSLESSSVMYPFACSKSIKTCNASLYHIDYGLDKDEISNFYNISSCQIDPIFRGNKQDYLISVPCSCKDINGSNAYFYDTSYVVQQNDTFINVSTQIYSGQALDVGEENFIVGNIVPMHLLCGCAASDTQIIVTYTVQQNDTLWDIASLLSANVSDIVRMNKNLIQNPDIIGIGWVLFVPSSEDGIPAPGPKKM